MTASYEDQPSSRSKRRRVKTGCLTCRTRKVKCDEARNVCTNCRCTQLTCEWPDGSKFACSPERAPSPVRNKPIVRTLACFNCRQARSKCSQTRPTCDRCTHNGLECDYPSSFKRRRTFAPATPLSSLLTRQESDSSSSHPPIEAQQHNEHSENVAGPYDAHLRNNIGETVVATGPSERAPPVDGGGRAEFIDEPSGTTAKGQAHAQDPTSIPTKELSERLIAAFFVHVHPYQANGYLHQDSTFQAVRDGEMPQQILFALWAVSARFLRPPIPVWTARTWADEAGTRLIRSRTTSRENIITALLLLTHSQYSGWFDQHHMWCAIANRQALSLGLHLESVNETSVQTVLEGERDRLKTLIEGERDRRLYHACYGFERQMSNGTPESVQCPATRVRTRLPWDESNYRMGIITETPEAVFEGDESSRQPWLFRDVGIMGFYVRLCGARYMVKGCVQSMLENKHVPFIAGTAPWESTSPFAACIKKLAEIMNSLPTRLRLTRGVILSRHDSPSLGPLVIVYLLWNMCHLELYRIILPGYLESLDVEKFSLAPEGWLEQSRQRCLRHAQAMTAILRLVAETMPREPLLITDHTFTRFVYCSIRVQIEFAEQHGMDEEASHELKVSFDIMMDFVARTACYFRPARLLMKATKKMIRVRGMALHNDEPIESREQTPPHPWFQKQKELDEEQERQSAQSATVGKIMAPPSRENEIADNHHHHHHHHHQQSWSNQDFDFLEGIFSNSLPDGMLSRGMSWMDSINASLLPGMDNQGAPGPHPLDGHHLSALNNLTGESFNPVMASDYSLTTVPDQWRSSIVDVPIPGADPFLPGQP